ncbi:hypothetical protein HDU82_006578 [Entophlyctis luteolus]|nr:hypothetical protein HDU82_006578 [Entophlyctis luteolus]
MSFPSSTSIRAGARAAAGSNSSSSNSIGGGIDGRIQRHLSAKERQMRNQDALFMESNPVGVGYDQYLAMSAELSSTSSSTSSSPIMGPVLHGALNQRTNAAEPVGIRVPDTLRFTLDQSMNPTHPDSQFVFPVLLPPAVSYPESSDSKATHRNRPAGRKERTVSLAPGAHYAESIGSASSKDDRPFVSNPKSPQQSISQVGPIDIQRPQQNIIPYSVINREYVFPPESGGSVQSGKNENAAERSLSGNGRVPMAESHKSNRQVFPAAEVIRANSYGKSPSSTTIGDVGRTHKMESGNDKIGGSRRQNSLRRKSASSNDKGGHLLPSEDGSLRDLIGKLSRSFSKRGNRSTSPSSSEASYDQQMRNQMRQANTGFSANFATPVDIVMASKRAAASGQGKQANTREYNAQGAVLVETGRETENSRRLAQFRARTAAEKARMQAGDASALFD